MKSLVLSCAVSLAALPAAAASVISVSDFDDPVTQSFAAIAPGTILSGEDPIDPAFAALGFTDVTAIGAGAGGTPFFSTMTGLGASADNEPMIVGSADPESLVELIVFLGREMTRIAFEIEASASTNIFTVQFLGAGSEIDSLDFDTDQGGSDGGYYALALESALPFDGLRFTGLDKAVIGSFTVESASPVPLPAGLSLLLAGLGGLGALRLRRRG